MLFITIFKLSMSIMIEVFYNAILEKLFEAKFIFFANANCQQSGSANNRDTPRVSQHLNRSATFQLLAFVTMLSQTQRYIEEGTYKERGI